MTTKFFTNTHTFYRQLIHNNWLWLKRAFFIFSAGLIGGIISYIVDPTLLNALIDLLLDKIGPDAKLDWSMAIKIFDTNLQASVMAALGGIVLGLMPIAALLFNGWILGYVITAALTTSVGPLAVLVGIVPHGIIEIPAFLLAAALGMRLGLSWLKPKDGTSRKESFRASFKAVVQSAPLIIVALFIAAIIEVFVSGRLITLLDAGL